MHPPPYSLSHFRLSHQPRTTHKHTCFESPACYFQCSDICFEDNLTPAWVATTLWGFSIAVLMSDMRYSILTLLLGKKNGLLAQDPSSLEGQESCVSQICLVIFTPVQIGKTNKYTNKEPMYKWWRELYKICFWLTQGKLTRPYRNV